MIIQIILNVYLLNRRSFPICLLWCSFHASNGGGKSGVGGGKSGVDSLSYWII